MNKLASIACALLLMTATTEAGDISGFGADLTTATVYPGPVLSS
jgi:hypothetical protein